jgi:hypothetical protein
MFQGIESTHNLTEYRVVAIHMGGISEEDMKLTPVRTALGICSFPRFSVNVRFAGHADRSKCMVSATELRWKVITGTSSSVTERIAPLDEVVLLREMKGEIPIEPFVG